MASRTVGLCLCTILALSSLALTEESIGELETTTFTDNENTVANSSFPTTSLMDTTSYLYDEDENHVTETAEYVQESFPNEIPDKIQADPVIPSNLKEMNWTNCHDEYTLLQGVNVDYTYRIGSNEEISSKRCDITLKTIKPELMAISIRNTHLNVGEMIQVVTLQNNITFVMKQFFGNEMQESLLLPDTNEVHIVVSSREKQLNSASTSFELKAFSYLMEENQIDSAEMVYGDSSAADDIYITTSQPNELSNVEG